MLCHISGVTLQTGSQSETRFMEQRMDFSTLLYTGTLTKTLLLVSNSKLKQKSNTMTVVEAAALHHHTPV